MTTVTATALLCLFSVRSREIPPVSVSKQSRKTMRAHWTVNRPKPAPERPAAHHQPCVFSIYDPGVVESTYCTTMALLFKAILSATKDGGGKLNAIIVNA